MSVQEDNSSYYERICWLIIFETLALSIFIYLNLNAIQSTSLKQLLISIILYLQLPAANFISDYTSKRIDKLKKFFVALAIVSISVIALCVIVYALKYQTLPTLVGLILFGVTLWLGFFPPKWFSNLVDKWKKRKKP